MTNLIVPNQCVWLLVLVLAVTRQILTLNAPCQPLRLKPSGLLRLNRFALANPALPAPQRSFTGGSLGLCWGMSVFGSVKKKKELTVLAHDAQLRSFAYLYAGSLREPARAGIDINSWL